MTLKLQVECDAANCSNEKDLYDTPTPELVVKAGWFLHPGADEIHYCPACWPACKAEIEQIRGEEI